VIGNPGSRPVELFQAALCRRRLPPARIVAWKELLEGRVALPEVVPPGAVVRLETPGRDFETERSLLAAGEVIADREGCERIPRQTVRALTADRGRILAPRQWYLGFRQALAQIAEQLAACPEHTRMNCPADVALMFDKSACHARLEADGIPVPRSLNRIRGYDELRQQMRDTGCPRVFVKLAHGSSASPDERRAAPRDDHRRDRATGRRVAALQ
jgi:hypothetical protein